MKSSNGKQFQFQNWIVWGCAWCLSEEIELKWNEIVRPIESNWIESSVEVWEGMVGKYG